MIYKMHKCGSYNIHTIKTDKFKNIRMEIIFRNNINRDNIASRTTLFETLVENSMDYKSKRELTLKEEYLYNALCYTSTNRVGKEVVSKIIMDFLNPKYTKDNFISDAIKLPFDLIFKPNVNNEEFDHTTVELIKEHMKASINNINDNPVLKAMDDAVLVMDKNSETSISVLGTIKDIDNITPSSLYKTYQNILEHDYVDVFVIGDINENEVLDEITKNVKLNTIKNHELSFMVDNKVRNKELVKIDKGNFSQSQIIYIYNTIKLNEFENKYVGQIYNIIFGAGSLDTKLSKKVRGDNSICYGIHSDYYRSDGLIFVQTSVDKDNIELARKLINEAFDEMGNNITQEEIDTAIKQYISSIKSGLDEPGRIINNYYFNYLNHIDDTEERIRNIQKVTLDDVYKFSKKVKLNTIYILKGDANGKD